MRMPSVCKVKADQPSTEKKVAEAVAVRKNSADDGKMRPVVRSPRSAYSARFFAFLFFGGPDFSNFGLAALPAHGF